MIISGMVSGKFQWIISVNSKILKSQKSSLNKLIFSITRSPHTKEYINEFSTNASETWKKAVFSRTVASKPFLMKLY